MSHQLHPLIQLAMNEQAHATLKLHSIEGDKTITLNLCNNKNFPLSDQ